MPEYQAGFNRFFALNEHDAPLLMERMSSVDLPVEGDRYGIVTRLIAKPAAEVVDLAEAVLQKLLDATEVSPNSLGAIVLTSRIVDPAGVAKQVTERLQLSCEGLGIERACSGFPAATVLAMNTVARLQKPVALIAAEIISRNINWEPAQGSLGDQQRARGQAAKLFADGAAAVLVSPAGENDRNVIVDAWQDHIEDEQHLIQKIDVIDSVDPWGNVREGETTCMSMPGRRGFWLVKRAPVILADAVKKSIRSAREAGLINDQNILHIIPHQPNGLILDRLKKLPFQEFDQVNVWNCIANTGNTVSASIPLAFAEAQAKISGPAILAMPSVGAGGPGYRPDKLSHGCVLVRMR